MDIEKAKYFISQHVKTDNSIIFIHDLLSIDNKLYSVLKDIDIIYDIILSQVSKGDFEQKTLSENNFIFTFKNLEKNRDKLKIEQENQIIPDIISCFNYDKLAQLLFEEKKIIDKNTEVERGEASLFLKIVNENSFFCNSIIKNLIYNTSSENSQNMKRFLLDVKFTKMGNLNRRKKIKNEKNTKAFIKNEMSLLHHSFERKNFFLCDLLITLGKEINEKDFEGNNLCFYIENKEQFDYLLKKDIDWKVNNNNYVNASESLVENIIKDSDFDIFNPNPVKKEDLKNNGFEELIKVFETKKIFTKGKKDDFIFFVDNNNIDVNSNIGMFHFLIGIDFYKDFLFQEQFRKIDFMLEKGLDVTKINPVDGTMLAHTLFADIHLFLKDSDKNSEEKKVQILDKIMSQLKNKGVFDTKDSINNFYKNLYKINLLRSMPQQSDGGYCDLNYAFEKTNQDFHELKDLFENFLEPNIINTYLNEKNNDFIKYLDNNMGRYSKAPYPRHFYEDDRPTKKEYNPVESFYFQSNRLCEFLINNDKPLPDTFKYQWNMYIISSFEDFFKIESNISSDFQFRCISKLSEDNKKANDFYKIRTLVEKVKQLPINFYHKRDEEIALSFVQGFDKNLNDIFGETNKNNLIYRSIIYFLKEKQDVFEKGQQDEVKKILNVSSFKNIDPGSLKYTQDKLDSVISAFEKNLILNNTLESGSVKKKTNRQVL